MESSPVEGSSQASPVMVQEESVLPDCPASSSDSTIAPSAVPNAREEQSPQVEVSTRDSPVKFNQPDFTYLEISSRPSREASCNYPMSSGQPEAPGHAGESPIEASSSIGNFPRGGDSQDIGAVMTTYDETLFREESRLASPACDFTPSRKRQNADFLPINAEIKRIGVEISEEHAKQLKNDVRRLSPILVSLRERTLGEISLTSDSGLFEDGERASDRIAESAAEGVSRSSEPSQELPIASESAGSSGLPETSLDYQDSASSSAELVSSSSSPAAKDSNLEAARHDEGPADHPKDADPSRRPGSPSTNPSAPNTPSQRSEAQRELMIVLSRVDHGSPAEGAARSEMAADRVIGNRPSDDSGVREGTAPPLIGEVASGVEKDRTNVAVECPVTGKDRQADTADSNAVLVGNVCLSPKYHDNDQLRRKSPKVVIERTLQEPASPIEKPKSEHNEESLLGVNLDRVRRTLEDSLDDEDDEEDDASLSDPLAINDDTSTVPVTTASDAPESLDTETGSLIEPTSSTCPETDSLVSDETPSRDRITRLEPERPEPFTEDSAESLALASGARDEVRSDGSDSGLGSEIPGDPGTAPAPESDSETSFLDRIPDDILSDKDKVVNPLEAFVPDPGTSGIQQQQQQHQEIHHHHQQQPQQLPLPSFPNPPKSSLKRRLTDCMEGEPSPKRINTDEPVRKKRNIQFDAVTVYYFPRAQGFTCVPSQGGSTLGMSATHTHAERFSLTEHAAEQRRLHRARLAQLRSERAANCGTEAASSSEDPSDDTDEEPSDAEELDIDSYYFLQPVPTWQRRALLRAAGIRRIDAIEKDDCRDIRASREHCGCGCKGYCDPESCPCSRANVKCQVDRAGFPCGCSRDGCANSSGRIEFNPVRVRTHFIHTLMRLQLDKKQRDEERTEHDLLMNSPLVRPMRELPGLMASPIGQMDHPNVTTGDPVACSNPNGFTSLHYDAHDQAPASSCTSGIVHPVREDSLDLYAIRDDCYPPADETDAATARKLHPEFGQAFQPFPGQQPPVNFPQTAYQDYQAYQTLASTSRSPYQPQFQTVQPANPNFAHYPYGQEPSLMQPACQSHQPVPTHHTAVYETGFAQEDPTGSQQHYTNLNSVQPINAVVQQMGKLEPFSELLAGRYSYYGDPEPQPVPVAAYHNSPPIAKLETDLPGDEQQPDGPDDCDENFGEIIKKSMVETVSA